MASNVNMNGASTGSGGTHEGLHRITSKFAWDNMSVLWEIQNISEAVGRTNLLCDLSSDSGELNDNHAIQEFHSLLDIDYINSNHFDAGNHPENKSVWSLALYKQTNPEYLGLFLHLLEIKSESAVNRRFHRNHSLDELDEDNFIYMKYTMSIVSPTGTVLHKIDNPTIIGVSSGSSWGEDKFLRTDVLWEPSYHFLTDDTLRIKVDLYLFHQFTHTINEREGSVFSEMCQAEASTLPGGSTNLSKALWSRRVCSDVIIECGDRVFSLHKCVLSVASPVFYAMFSSNMEEASQNKVTIVDTDPAVFEAMLEYVYTDKISENWNWNDFDELSQLLNVCEKYQIKPLKEFCLKMVCDRIAVSNAGEIAILIHLYNAEEFVKSYVYNFIAKNMTTLRQQPGFIQLFNLNIAAFAPILLSDAFCGIQRPV